HEDYESLILRLCAGEGGFAVTEPPGIAEVFRDQADSPNPDLSIVSDLRSTLIRLVPGALAAAAPDVHTERYAPPSPEPEDVTTPELPFLDEPEADPEPPTPNPVTPDPENRSPAREADPSNRCEYCGGILPDGRRVNFCPHCGESQTRIHCPDCGQEAEAGWRHCVGCGHAFDED
ncbi:MAG: double zinc ribbon domain-containing protein, partial [Gemmatimonadales bacterium]